MSRPPDDPIDSNFYVTTVPGTDEMNLVEFPFASLRTVQDSRTIITYEGWTRGENGERHHQKWEVTGSSKAGLPTEFDERVFIALMAITAAGGFASDRVPFSVYQVLKIMGLGDRPSDYRKVERALDRLVGVTIYAEGAFWDNDRKTRATVKTGFHIIDKYWLSYKEEDDEIREREGVAAYIVWSHDIWQSFEAGYIKRLDLDFFYGLDRPLARRLYRFLDKRMHYRKQFEIDIFELAGRLGMARYKTPSRVKEKLTPAFEELIEQGYLESAEAVKVRRYTRIRFTRTADLPTDDGAPVPLAAGDDVPLDARAASLARRLEEAGLTAAAARELVARHAADLVEEKLEMLDWLEARDPGRIRHRSGWLRRAIEEDYAAPPGFAAGEEPLPSRTYQQRSLFESLFTSLDVMEAPEPPEAPAPPHVDEASARLWRIVLDDLQLQMTRATYDACLRGAQLERAEENRFLISVPSPSALEWLDNRLGRIVRATMARYAGAPVELAFELREG